MNGFSRSLYAAAAAIALLFASRRTDAASRWSERAKRWRAKAKAEAPQS